MAGEARVMELPECPVCLQNYEADCVIPRVLACGHSACEVCLAGLPERYPETIRCPECIQLVKRPASGPSALPKNIDLLRLCMPQNPDPNNHISKTSREPPPSYDDRHRFLPRFWSEEFYSLWKDWVLPSDAVFIEPKSEEEGGGGESLCAVLPGRTGSASSMPVRLGFRENQRVKLVRLVSLPVVDESSVFDYSYFARIMRCLTGMKEKERDELGLLLRASLRRQSGMCCVYGLWGDLEGGFLDLVCERLGGSLLEKLYNFRNGVVGGGGDSERLSQDFMSGLAMIGVGICEAVVALHLEALVIGCLGPSCFTFNDFGHIYVDLSEVLVAGRKVRKSVVEAVSGRTRINSNEFGVIFRGSLEREAFLSPELLFELLQKEGVAVEDERSSYTVNCSSDVWSLACLLISLIIGKSFTEEILEISLEGSDYSTLYVSWVEKVISLLETNLGSTYASLSQILVKCLNLDPACRPLATDLRRCLRELLIKSQFDALDGFEGVICEDDRSHCLIFGKLCQLPTERTELGKDDGRELDQVDERVDRNFVGGLSEGVIKFKDLQGHLDCITALAVGGGFLFSSSFDKTIHVWSLQDFSHVHTFRGHGHRVMALVYVNEEQLCVSGDNGGGIFVWGSSAPLIQDPLKKWYEEKDWRYSGIHALTTSGNGYLYTGSGDRSIKAWSLQDGILSCTMNGHKSVVSCLAVCDGVLYSGSWDGTIRLWNLNDHSPLTVLGEDKPGTVTSVLSLAADKRMLIAAHENGYVKVWSNDVLRKSAQLHSGAIFATAMEDKRLFTGGWEKIVKVQELSGDEFEVEVIPTGSIPCASVITALLCWQGKLMVGYADRSIKVYFYGK